MEQIDFLEADSHADDHTLCIVLHKHSPAAKGNDRNKQGVIVIASNAQWQGRKAEATGDEERSALERCKEIQLVLITEAFFTVR